MDTNAVILDPPPEGFQTIENSDTSASEKNNKQKNFLCKEYRQIVRDFLGTLGGEDDLVWFETEDALFKVRNDSFQENTCFENQRKQIILYKAMITEKFTRNLEQAEDVLAGLNEKLWSITKKEHT